MRRSQGGGGVLVEGGEQRRLGEHVVGHRLLLTGGRRGARGQCAAPGHVAPSTGRPLDGDRGSGQRVGGTSGRAVSARDGSSRYRAISSWVAADSLRCRAAR